MLPKKEKPNRLAGFAERLASIRSIFVSTVVIAVSIMAVFLVFQELAKSKVVIEPFGVPADLEKLGYSPKVIAIRLKEKCTAIVFGAWTGAKRRGIELDVGETKLDVEVPETHLSLKTIVNYINEFWGRKPLLVSGEIVGPTNQLQLVVRIDKSLTNRPPAQPILAGPLDSLDTLLDQAATNILKQTHPYIMGVIFFRNHDTNEAWEMVRSCKQNDSAEEKAWGLILWGNLLAEQKQYSNAFQIFEQAKDFNQDTHFAVNVNLGTLASDQSNFDDALRYYNENIKRRPNFSPAYLVRGLFYNAIANYPLAMADANKAINLDGNFSEAYLCRAFVNIGLTNYAAAIADYTKELEFHPDDKDTYLLRGQACGSLTNYSEAIGDYQRAINIDTNYYDAYYACGLDYLILKNYAAAITNFSHAIQINPDSYEAIQGRGDAKWALMDYSGARDDYARSGEIDPSDLRSRLFLAHVQNEHFQFVPALENYRACLSVSDYCHFCIWLIQTRLKDPAADPELLAWLKSLPAAQTNNWPPKIGWFLLGKLTDQELFREAGAQKGQVCEANYYAGMKHLLGGDTNGAVNFFQACLHTGQTNYDEFHSAEAELNNLKKPPANAGNAPASP